MKRLGLFAFISMVFISVLVFSAPEKTYAAITSNDLATIKGFSDSYTSVGGLSGEHARIFITKFLALADKNYAALKDAPTATLGLLEKNTVTEFIAYLDDIINTSSTPTPVGEGSTGEVDPGIKNSAIQAKILATDQLNAADNRVKLERGEISRDQYNQNLNNSANKTATTLAQTADNQSKDVSLCNLFDGNLAGCMDSLISWVIKHTLLPIATFLLWLSANIFNLGVQLGILNFSSWAPDSLYTAWLVVRQALNVVILFAGLYLGFLYIIGKDDKFAKYIPWVVIYALFVNLSYPISRIPIDVSNVIALNVYAGAVGSDALGGSMGNLVNGSGQSTPGTLIVNRLGLSNMISGVTNKPGNAKDITDTNSTPGALMVTAYVLYAAFILFMISLMLVVRTAILVFLTIASPLLFVDAVVPWLGDAAVKMRKLYFEQLAVAPVFMIMFALTLKFLEVFQSPGGAFKNGIGGNAQVFFNTLMMLVMLHIMYKVTKKIGGEAGNMATNFMGKVGGFGLGVATGGAGLLARGTIGNRAMALRDSTWMRNNRDSFIGKNLYSMSNSLANSSFDARNTQLIGGNLKNVGMGMGEGRKLGFEKAREARDTEKVEELDFKRKFQRNVYDQNGDLLHRKGDVDESMDPQITRYVNRAGGVLLGRPDLRQKLKDSIKSGRGKATSEYQSLEEQERQKFFDSQDQETRDKLLKQDAKLAYSEQKEKIKESERQQDRETNRKMAESQQNLADALTGKATEPVTPLTNPLNVEPPEPQVTSTPTHSETLTPTDMNKDLQTLAAEAAARRAENKKDPAIQTHAERSAGANLDTPAFMRQGVPIKNVDAPRRDTPPPPPPPPPPVAVHPADEPPTTGAAASHPDEDDLKKAA
ncbi:MAG: hypothetical protein JWN37_157 [Candidatus Nomurabacteria bacterium]|nr:hypothetical protein [Candidatus Nomurabacteria bacterium]